MAAQSSANPVGLLLLGILAIVFGAFAHRDARRGKRIPRIVKRGEPDLTQEKFNSRNMKGTFGLVITGLCLVGYAVLRWLVDR